MIGILFATFCCMVYTSFLSVCEFLEVFCFCFVMHAKLKLIFCWGSFFDVGRLMVGDCV